MNIKELKKYRKEIKTGWYGRKRSDFVDHLMWNVILTNEDMITKCMLDNIDKQIKLEMNREYDELKIRLEEIEMELENEQS